MVVIDEATLFLEARSPQGFVETPYLRELVERALLYIKAGFPVHFRGGAGTGKTTLALHIAAKLGRPIVLIYGNDEYNVSDLIGGYFGYKKKTIIDNYVHTVHKTEEDAVRRWVDQRLTTACRYGYTLVYDEFTRSRPETNNVLLSILEERILDLPIPRGGDRYLQVDPNFAAIFTSNPQEYVGVHKSQDALEDRMITIDLDYFDLETEIAITRSKSGISREGAEKIVTLVRALRDVAESEAKPTIRAPIMIAKATKSRKARVSVEDGQFVRICMDILSSAMLRGAASPAVERVRSMIGDSISKYC
ncbi:MAG: gas vesicle protein GvpN [Firmicutes bacterium]|nr:gas vesicle protein GvpN [Bacillota bacterium]